jgi:hypothetical protein
MKCECGLELDSDNSYTTWKKGWKERVCNECSCRIPESMSFDAFMRNSPRVSDEDRQKYINGMW